MISSISSQKYLLYIEDDASHRYLFERLCASLGLIARSVSSTTAAEYYLSHPKEGESCFGIFVDLCLPVEDGYSFARRIRAGHAGAEHASIQLIAISALDDPNVALKARLAGFEILLLKPLRLKHLEMVLGLMDLNDQSTGEESNDGTPPMCDDVRHEYSHGEPLEKEDF